MFPSASSWREGIPPLPLTVDAREDGVPIGWQTLAQILPTPKGNVVGALKRRVDLPRANREGGAFWDGEAGNRGRASDGLPMRNPSTDCVGKSQVHTHRPIVRLPSGWRRAPPAHLPRRQAAQGRRLPQARVHARARGGLVGGGPARAGAGRRARAAGLAQAACSRSAIFPDDPSRGALRRALRLYIYAECKIMFSMIVQDDRRPHESSDGHSRKSQRLHHLGAGD